MDSSAQTATDYPVQLAVDYPDRPLNRLTTFFRVFTIIPIAIVLAAVSGVSETYSDGAGQTETVAIGAGGVLFLGPLLMILFREKYPRWWFDWNLQLARFTGRVASTGSARRPLPVDGRGAVAAPGPRLSRRSARLNRWLPLVKWLLAIPHLIVLVFLGLAAFVCVVIAWFAILFTGRYPRGLFDFVVGVGRWWLRVAAYAFLLTTDRYPPFSLEA